MDIIQAVEAVRSYKEEITSSIDMASALREIRTIRSRKDAALSKHEMLFDKLTSPQISSIYGSIGAVQTSGKGTARQELLEQCADLMKSIKADTALLYDAVELVESTVEAISDHDTRMIIEYKYLKGRSDTEIEELFCESPSGYTQRLERQYFQSLGKDINNEQ